MLVSKAIYREHLKIKENHVLDTLKDHTHSRLAIIMQLGNNKSQYNSTCIFTRALRTRIDNTMTTFRRDYHEKNNLKLVLIPEHNIHVPF